jgi:outer membrane protein
MKQKIPDGPPHPMSRNTEFFEMKRTVLASILFIICAGKNFADETNALPVLTLAGAEKLALQNHPRIAAADFRALAAQETVNETRAGFYPNANLYADAVGANDEGTRILAGGLNNPGVYDRAAGGISVSQLITDFGHTANLAASSQFRAQAENQNANATREQILLQVNTDYFGALAAQSVLDVARQTFDTRKLLLDQVTVLATNKLRSELDVSFAQVALEEGRLLVQKAENHADAAMASLSTALGENGLHEFQLVKPAPSASHATNDISGLIETALSSRPELLSLHDESNAAMRFAKSERDARLPTVSAFGEAGAAPVHDSHLPDDYAVGGIQISLPLFAGGLYTARQHEAELKANADAEMLRDAENDIIRDVRVAWLNLNDANAQLRTTKELVAHASEAYDLAESRYKNGISSIVELSQAQLSLTSAQIDDINTRYNVLLQQVNLDYQTGALR